MNYGDYAKYKEVSLDIFRHLEKILKEDEKLIHKKLDSRYKNLKENRFSVAVVGEVKAGKSTFLNALLGKELLPTDILQATSMIIEIHKSEKEYVEITFGNGEKENVVDDLNTPDIDEAFEAVKKYGALREEYRDLPIVQLNDFLINHYDCKEKTSAYSKETLNEFIDSLNNEDQKSKEKIVNYLNENKSLSNIPVHILIGYPLEWEFDSFTLVDTPGVNACGGIEDKTIEWIHEANAIIYLTRIKPIESKSFNGFVSNTLPDKQKDCLMLILSHASEVSDSDRKKIMDESKRLFPGIIHENIFAVDSLTELYKKQLENLNWEEISRIRKENTFMKKHTADAFETAEGDKDRFVELLESQSGFASFKKKIWDFSEKAGNIQVKELLEIMIEKFKEIDGDVSTNLEDTKMRHKEPQSFMQAAEKIEKEMVGFEVKRKEDIHKINEKYNLLSSENTYRKKIDKINEEFKAEVNGKTFNADDTKADIKSYMPKIFSNFSDKIDKEFETIKKEISSDAKKLEIEDKEKFDITLPGVNIEEIMSNAEESSYEYENRKEDGFGGWCKRWLAGGVLTGWGYENVKVFRAQKYWEKTRSDVCKDIDNAANQFCKNTAKTIRIFSNLYSEEISKKINERKDRLADLKKDELTNKDLEDQIVKLENKKKMLNQHIRECKKITGSL
jgi:GTPase SAR1 family protein